MLGINNIQKTSMIYKNQKIDLIFNFKTIENLYYNLQTWGYETKNPLTFIENFCNKKYKDKREYYLLLSSFLNGSIEEEEVINIIDNNKLDELLINLLAVIISEIKTDDIFEKDKDTEEEENIKDSSIDDEKNFIYFWDNSYYIAKIVLKMTDEEFYNTTPKILYTLQKIDREYKKNIILERDIEIQKAKIKSSDIDTGSNKKKEKVVMCKSFRDLL